MGSEGRGWHGAAAAGTDEGVGGRAEKPTTTTTAVVAAGAPADVPTSAASVDITLPLSEMTPHIMQVPWPSAAPSSPVFFF
jgi:ethanolamine kinase